MPDGSAWTTTRPARTRSVSADWPTTQGHTTTRLPHRFASTRRPSGTSRSHPDGPSAASWRSPCGGGKLAIALRRIKGILEGEGLSYGPGHHNEYIMRVGYMLNRYGISKRKATEWAISAFADYGEAQVRSIMRSCYQQTDEHATRPTRGNRAPTFDEIEATINELA